MPICQNCHHSWTWKQTFRRSLILDGGMKCPYCNKMQYYTSRFRKGSSIVTIVIIGLIMTSNLIFGPSYIFVGALLALIPLYSGIFPVFVKLSNEREHLFK